MIFSTYDITTSETRNAQALGGTSNRTEGPAQ